MAETTTIRQTTSTGPTLAERRLARLRRYRTRTTTTRTIRRGLPIIVPVVLGLGVAAYLLWGRDAPGDENKPDVKPTPLNGGGGRASPPIGPRPPNTWGNLPRATVNDSQGLLAREGAGTNFQIGTGGGNKGDVIKDPNKDRAPWPGTTVAVLQTGLKGQGADEWAKIITPGGYELFVASVINGTPKLTPVPGSAPFPAPGTTATAGTAVAGHLPPYQPVYPHYPQPVYPYAASPWPWGYPGNLEIVGRRR